MANYKVVLTPTAYEDIDKIYEYISLEKLAPINAKKMTDKIWKKLATLKGFPNALPLRKVGKYRDKGYRQIFIDNYVAIYDVDDENKIVTVLTVQYQGRNI